MHGRPGAALWAARLAAITPWEDVDVERGAVETAWSAELARALADEVADVHEVPEADEDWDAPAQLDVRSPSLHDPHPELRLAAARRARPDPAAEAYLREQAAFADLAE
jgi:hypothetical protein